MRRSTEFDATVKYGVRTARPDVVVYLRRGSDSENATAVRVGLIIAKSVGSAVERHRVARRLRHAVRTMLGELGASDQMVIRALPGSGTASSVRLKQELQCGLRQVLESVGKKS